jgi:hypothetical protein
MEKSQEQHDIPLQVCSDKFEQRGLSGEFRRLGWHRKDGSELLHFTLLDWRQVDDRAGDARWVERQNGAAGLERQ